MNKLLVALLTSVCLYTACLAEPVTAEQAMHAPSAEVEPHLAESHPAILYTYAARLFGEGRKDEAVFWFYVGQLRFRYHLAANPSLRPDEEPALMAALNETVGGELNFWAGGSPKNWVAAIDKALDWDARNDNPTTPKNAHAKELESTRKGLIGLRDQLKANADSIQEQRRQRGMEVR